ncbi:Interferon-inducible double stranded RNA-dependent protein kinase activator A-like protein [Dinothrombium tinctorium]|uniref:Interferon-inducible double stranded RNA-dependent protein kinase activator A-like protein n=1 Tax=Dinothrombium tinctorium TaxID=1965070 RepID=A0A3S3PPB7_9ACAR|nr:Interferon-inducible double stranded RNA-dependent protein kinase activator A-like protein [Dinothrombium tinctorium]
MDFQRTPISVLQDYCSRLNLNVDYQLLSVEGLVHAPTFAYRVQVGDEITATATGQSKKKAKHAAALNALQMLAQKPHLIGADCDELSSSIAHFLCMRKRWPPPQYDKCQESGLPHERTFTMVCELSTLNLSVYGSGRSKKIAKRIAAQEMLQLLEAKNLYDPSASTQSVKSSKDTSSLHDYSSPSANVDLCKDQLDNFWKDVQVDFEYEEHEDSEACAEIIQELAEKIECNIKYLELPCIDINQKLVLLNLVAKDKQNFTVPVATSWAKSESFEKAKEVAAKQLLSFISKLESTEKSRDF